MHRIQCAAALLMLALAGCGGGGGGSSFSGSSGGGSSSGISGAANVAAIAVNSGPAAAMGGAFNIPYVTVTVCAPGTSTCAVINDVLVDTASYGLRLMASAVTAANNGLSLPPTVDPANPGNTLAECAPFADGYTWGAITVADVKISGEVAHSVPVNVIDDNSSYAPTAPSTCTSVGGNNIGTVPLFAANGVLGVGVFAQDCGVTCTPCGNPSVCPIGLDLYYSCNNGSNTCTQTQLPLTAQVTNPVAMFAADNNGVIVQLQSIAPTGANSATGSLVFGIGTQSNNGLASGVTVLTADGSVGNFTTTLTTTGQSFADAAFIDSGSNAYFFPDSTLAQCGTNAPGFYCPTSTAPFSAVNQGMNGTSNTVGFQIADLNSFSNSSYAIDDIGGTTTGIGGGGANTDFFDWGMPFFYGRTVYFAIDGLMAAGTTGPYYAY